MNSGDNVVTVWLEQTENWDIQTYNPQAIVTPIYHTRDHMTTQLFVGLDKLLMMHHDGSTMKPIEIVNTNKTSLDYLQQTSCI